MQFPCMATFPSGQLVQDLTHLHRLFVVCPTQEQVIHIGRFSSYCVCESGL